MQVKKIEYAKGGSVCIGMPPLAAWRARGRDDPLRRSSLVASCFFNTILDFALLRRRTPTARHPSQSFSKGYLQRARSSASIRLLAQHVSSHSVKEAWPAAPTSKSSASPTPRRTLNATAGRVPAWRAGGARRCRACRTRRTGIRTGSARTRKSRGAPSTSSRWSRTLCSVRLVRRCGACLGHCRVKRRRTPSRTTGVVRRIPGTRPSPIVTPCVEINQCRSRRWRGGRRGDSGRTRRKILISTQVTPLRRTRARRSSP